MGTTRQKSSCRNRLQNGPRSLSQVKAGTHSPSPTGSHTAAYTPKQGGVSDGALSLPSTRAARSRTSPGRVSERRTLPLLGLGRGCAPEERREPSGQRCAHARRCPEASRPRWAALLCLQFGDVAVFLLCAQYFLNVQSEGWYHYPRRALRAAETPDGRLSKRLIFRFLVSPIYICERPCRVLPISALIQIDCRSIPCGHTACP